MRLGTSILIMDNAMQRIVLKWLRERQCRNKEMREIVEAYFKKKDCFSGQEIIYGDILIPHTKTLYNRHSYKEWEKICKKYDPYRKTRMITLSEFCCLCAYEEAMGMYLPERITSNRAKFVTNDVGRLDFKVIIVNNCDSKLETAEIYYINDTCLFYDADTLMIAN